MRTIRVKMMVWITVMALFAITLISGCSSGNNQQGAGGNNGSNTGTAANSTGETASKPETVKITFWEQGWDGPKQDKILPVINQKTGVNLQYDPWVVTSEEERQNKLSLLSASGEIPDVFYGSTDDWTRSLFNKLGEQGKLWDLTPFLKKYPNVNKVASASIPLFRDSKDKHVYIYPTQMSSLPEFPLGYNVRYDWLKKVGMDYPKSLDEFHNMLKAFKDQIKTTSGKPVIPLAFTPGLNAREFWWIVPWFGDDASSSTWSKTADGSYTKRHLTDIPHLQNMLAYFNMLYREGLLDQEALTIKDSQLKEKIAQDRIGVQMLNGYETSSIVDGLVQAGQKDAMYVMLPWFFDQGVTNGNYHGDRKLGPGAPSGVYVSKKLSEAQVDALFKALDWIMTPEGQILVNFGIEGDHWEYDADHKIQKTKAFMDRAQADWNKEAHEGVGYYQQLGNYAPMYIDMLPNSTRFSRPESKPNLENQKSIWSANPSENLDPIVYVNPGQTEQTKLPTIENAWKDMVIKAILAKSVDEARSIAASWPDTLKGLGWDEIVKEREANVKAVDLSW